MESKKYGYKAKQQLGESKILSNVHLIRIIGAKWSCRNRSE